MRARVSDQIHHNERKVAHNVIPHLLRLDVTDLLSIPAARHLGWFPGLPGESLPQETALMDRSATSSDDFAGPADTKSPEMAGVSEGYRLTSVDC